MKMAAFDAEDLLVLSALLEGGLMAVSDMTFQPQDQRFVAVLRRRAAPEQAELVQAGLHFERVTRVSTTRFPDRKSGTTLKLIGIGFTEIDAPSGDVILMFEDEIAIRLSVECLEVGMSDLETSDTPQSRTQQPS